MGQISAFPAAGGVMFDLRDEGRSLRVGWHPNDGVLVLSIWRTDTCVATCRLSREDAAALIAELASGLAELPQPILSAVADTAVL